MLKYPVTLLIFIVLVGGVLYYLGYRMPNTPAPITPMDTDVEYTVEEFVNGLEVPWSIVWTSGARMLVSERPGRIRVVENGKLLEKPLHTFPEVVSQAEEGLMSLAVHPQYAQNKYVYAVYAYNTERGLWDTVVRFKDDGDSISDITTIINGIPAAQYHAGSRLAFGPDGKLYITTGDATVREIAQDLDNLGGKILRVNDDGTIPADNPFPNSPVWSYGHRNPQGIAWDSNGNMFETEHGPSGFDGPGGGDEVNQIHKGLNYGWPLVSHGKSAEGVADPFLVFTPAEAPASAMVYSGKLFPQFKDTIFFGSLRGENLMHVAWDPDPRSIKFERLFLNEYGRIRDVAEGPDGSIYFSTSNRDGRGSPAASDDRIFRIVPK